MWLGDAYGLASHLLSVRPVTIGKTYDSVSCLASKVHIVLILLCALKNLFINFRLFHSLPLFWFRV